MPREDISQTQVMPSDAKYLGYIPVTPSNWVTVPETVQKALDALPVATGVTAAAVIADHAIVRGDGGARGIQDSLLSIDDAGDLNMAGHDIQFVSYIRDVSGNEQIAFGFAFFAVNFIAITNAATGVGPSIAAAGSDANIDLFLLSHGTGKVKSADDFDVTGDITLTGTVDGRDVAADGTVLDTAALLPGQAGGQTLQGGTAGSENLSLESTSHGTKGEIISKDHHEFVKGAAYDAVYDNGNVDGNIVIDWTNGNVQKITLTGNVTQVLFTNPPGPCNCRLWIYQDGTGGRTIADNWDADVYWGGTAPVVSADADNFDLGVFEYDGASTYAAQMAQGIDGLGFNPPGP